MTETEWRACSDPGAMLAFLRAGKKASKRKLRLFACACCRSIWRLIRHPDCRRAVEISEHYADGMATAAQLRAAARRAGATASELAFEATVVMRMGKWAARDAAEAATMAASTRLEPDRVVAKTRSALTFTSDRPVDECGLLRDLIGNSFRTLPPLDPAMVAWNKGTVVALARTVYDERAFERLLILADALEEAGCTDTDILGHCRGPGPHVRGCWVVDLLLGKS